MRARITFIHVKPIPKKGDSEVGKLKETLTALEENVYSLEDHFSADKETQTQLRLPAKKLADKVRSTKSRVDHPFIIHYNVYSFEEKGC